jgi:SNF2 family DNA or RNA helicase
MSARNRRQKEQRMLKISDNAAVTNETPQRVEQRIGRCHRYGQEHDVVVVNFLNVKNEADLRVYQLLSEKFRLFDGLFGSSDDSLALLNHVLISKNA